MNKYETKKILLIMFCISTVMTVIGLGLSAYNYYVFDKPFMNSTTQGILNAFFLCTLIVTIGLAKIKKPKNLIRITKTILALAITLFTIYLATPIIKIIYDIGINFGEAMAKWF